MDPIQKKRESLKTLLAELKAHQEKHSAADAALPTQAEADAIDAKATEAETLHKDIAAHDAREKRLTKLTTEGAELTDPTLPADRGTKLQKEPGSRIVGYMELGNFITASGGMKAFQEQGRQKGPVEIHRFRGMKLERFIPITQKMIDTKAVPTIDESVIEPTRLPDLVRVTEHQELRLRDVLDVSRTTSDAVKYTRLVSYTRAATAVANSASKPEGTLELDSVTEAVRTLAVHIPVEEQQLADLPSLAGLINGELLYDLAKLIEELVIWGNGAGENFDGIAHDTDVQAARSESGDTLIDIARRGITDVRRAGYSPNGIAVDPLDWEDIVLAKGSDNRYVWVVVTEGPVQRLWSVPVIETSAMTDFQGNDPEARVMLVGDFARGATLWDRMDAAISVGWINDQFIKNQRTILAELRAAFGVRRPGAFRKHTTQAAGS